jgi:hypothetical protein
MGRPNDQPSFVRDPTVAHTRHRVVLLESNILLTASIHALASGLRSLLHLHPSPSRPRDELDADLFQACDELFTGWRAPAELLSTEIEVFSVSLVG